MDTLNFELKNDNNFKKSSLTERLEKDRKFYDIKYKTEDFYHSITTEKAFISSLIRKYNIKKGSHIIDVGCGTGFYCNLFYQEKMHVSGLDFSKLGIKKARAKYGVNINWVLEDINQLSDEFTNKFDIVYCSNFSPFILSTKQEDLALTTKKLLSLLKKKGLLFFIYSSNLSGKRDADSVIFNYNISQIENIFCKYNKNCEIIESFITNRQYFPIFRSFSFNSVFSSLSKFILKIHKKNVRLIVVIQKGDVYEK